MMNDGDGEEATNEEEEYEEENQQKGKLARCNNAKTINQT